MKIITLIFLSVKKAGKKTPIVGYSNFIKK